MSTMTNDLKESPTTENGSSNMSYQANAFEAMCDMMDNFNTMIAMNTSSIRQVEEDNIKSTATWNRKFDVLLHQVKILDRRLEDIEHRTKANTRGSTALSHAAGTFVDSTDIMESRLSSIESRVSSIERLLIQSRKRKRSRAERN